MTHTKGKLIAVGDCVCDIRGNSLWDYHGKTQKKNEANTRRLVACWNALDGVPTSWIKKYAGRPLKNIVEQSCDLVRKEDELLQELLATQEENDALKAEVERLKASQELESEPFDNLRKAVDAVWDTYDRTDPIQIQGSFFIALAALRPFLQK